MCFISFYFAPDPVQKVLIDFLVEKKVAFTVPCSTKVFVLPLLTVTEEDLWSQSEDVLCVFRHLLTKKGPHEMFTMFSEVSAKIAEVYTNISIRKYAVIIHGDGFKARVDLGPCLIDQRIVELRIVVQSQSADIARNAVNEITKALPLREIVETFEARVSCQKCFKSTIPLEKAEDAEKKGEQVTITCPICKYPCVVSQILCGYQETRPLPDLLTPVVSGQANFGQSQVFRYLCCVLCNLVFNFMADHLTFVGEFERFCPCKKFFWPGEQARYFFPRKIQRKIFFPHKVILLFERSLGNFFLDSMLHDFFIR